MIKDKLRDKIIEANPKLLELSFGCKVYFEKEDWETVVTEVYTKDLEGKEISDIIVQGTLEIPFKKFQKNWKILGHPPTLEHVLVAIEKNSVISPLKVAVSGCIYDGEAGAPLVCWQLGLPLSDQSQELKDFLSKLLT